MKRRIGVRLLLRATTRSCVPVGASMKYIQRRQTPQFTRCGRSLDNLPAQSRYGVPKRAAGSVLSPSAKQSITKNVADVAGLLPLEHEGFDSGAPARSQRQQFRISETHHESLVTGERSRLMRSICVESASTTPCRRHLAISASCSQFCVLRATSAVTAMAPITSRRRVISASGSPRSQPREPGFDADKFPTGLRGARGLDSGVIAVTTDNSLSPTAIIEGSHCGTSRGCVVVRCRLWL
jgi:hypothetical protein